METVFKVGMKVYDSVLFPKSEGKVVKIEKHIDCERVIVQFDCLNYELSYTERGLLTSIHSEAIPTLSTSPYTFEGFEQKAPVITFEEAWEEAERVYEPKSEYDKEEYCGYPTQKLADASEALRILLFLRDYYNEGWQPDWSDENEIHFCIRVENNSITVKNNLNINNFNAILVFRDYVTRDKFFNEQRKLITIAKPLL